MRMLKRGVSSKALPSWEELTPAGMFTPKLSGTVMGDDISSYVADFYVGVDPDYTKSESDDIVNSWDESIISGDAMCLHLRLVHEDISNNSSKTYTLTLVLNGNTLTKSISFSTNYDAFLYFPVPVSGSYALVTLSK